MSSAYCPNAVFCREGMSYWCCANDQQCGINRGTCYSQKTMNHLLIIGGSILGIFMFVFLVKICYSIRSSHIKEKNKTNTKTKTYLSFQQQNLSYINQSSTITQTSFSNPISMILPSSSSLISQSNNSTNN